MNPHDTVTRVMQAYQSREEPERLYAVAGKYWRIMLTVTVVLFCAAVAGGAYMLLTTFFNFAPNKSQAIPQHSLSRDQLTQVISGFENRKGLFEQLQTSSAPISDPSR